MGLKLDYTIEVVTDVYQVDYVQTYSYENKEFDPAPRSMFVISTDLESAKYYAEDWFRGSGDIFDVLQVTKLVSAQLDFMSYRSEEE